MKYSKTRYKQKGFSLVEILVVLAIIGVGFLAIITFLLYTRGVTFQIARNTDAITLAEEGMEAVRKLRDIGWSTNITPLIAGTTYYPAVSGGNWSLSTTNPGLIKNLYTRTVVLEDVNRDANDNISGSGTNDPNTQKITLSVSWSEGSNNKQVVLTTYITNFLDN